MNDGEDEEHFKKGGENGGAAAVHPVLLRAGVQDLSVQGGSSHVHGLLQQDAEAAVDVSHV